MADLPLKVFELLDEFPPGVIVMVVPPDGRPFTQVNHHNGSNSLIGGSLDTHVQFIRDRISGASNV